MVPEPTTPPDPDSPPRPGAFSAQSTSQPWLAALFVHRRTALIALFLVAVGLAPGLLRLESDNSPEIFFVDGSPRLEDYGELRRLFPGDQALRIVLRGPRVFERDGLQYLGHLEKDLGRLTGVAAVSGLPTHYQRVGWPPREAHSFRHQAAENRLDRQAGWISASAQAASLLIELEPQDPVARRATLAAIEELLPINRPAGLQTDLIGLPILNLALDASSQEIGKRYLPLLVGCTLLLLVLALRDLRATAILLVYVGLGLIWTLAPLGYADRPLNLILAILPPLLFAMGVANGVHLLVDYRHRRETSSAPAAAHGTFREKTWPLLGSGLTTVLGFASLASSPVLPIRELGLWAAWGLVALTALAFLFLPLGLLFCRATSPGAGRLEQWARRGGRILATWASDRPRTLLGGVGLAAAAAVFGLSQLEVESNALRYLRPDHPLRVAIETAEADGIGVATVEMLISLPGDAATFERAFQVEKLAQLAQVLSQRHEVLGVLDAGTLFRDTAMGVVTTPFDIALQQQLVLESIAQDAQGRVALARLLSADRKTARVTVFVQVSGSDELERTLAALESAALESFPAARVATTGQYPLLLEAQENLISTLLLSLGSSLLTIGLVLRYLLGSWRLTVLALIPNIWPILCVLGGMGFLGIPLDIATVMVASIVLGLVVDDTLHSFGLIRSSLATLDRREAVITALEKSAPAFLLTGTILVAGFGVCTLSDFGPISRFGGLSAAALLLGLAADLVLVPALVSLAPEQVLARLRS